MVQENNGMGQASMVLGILAIAGVCCCYGGLLFGSLAVIFALLSKTEEKMSDHARIGLITGIIGMVLSFIGLIGIAGIWAIDLFVSSGYGYGGGIHI